jgi:hypothetical protein
MNKISGALETAASNIQDCTGRPPVQTALKIRRCHGFPTFSKESGIRTASLWTTPAGAGGTFT